MWARSMTLAIRKQKCWVNAILPIMFIKEMNKLVTLRMKHDQKANLKLAPHPLFFCCIVVCLQTVSGLHALCLSDTTSINLGMLKSDPVCEDLWYGHFTSRWWIAPLPPPGVRGGSGTGALRWTDCVTGQGGTKQTVLGRRTPLRQQEGECEQAWWISLWPLWHSTFFVTQWFLNYLTELGQWEVAKLQLCLYSQDLL